MSKNKTNSPNVSTGSEPWVDPDDAPELTDEWLDYIDETAEIRDGDTIIRPGRPPLDDVHKMLPVRVLLDADVLKAYRSLGPGWWIRLNTDLRKARKLGPKPETD